MKGINMKLNVVAMGVMAAFLATPGWAADASKVNWSAVPKSEITLFYPGQASYEFVKSKKHPGSNISMGGKDAAINAVQLK